MCAKYFERYELDLESLRLRCGTLENKQNDWQKVLIEPQTLNDAKVYALEARLEREEDVRIQEYEILRETIRKMVFSLE